MLFTVSASSIIFFLLIALSPIPQLRKQKDIASSNLASSQEDIVKLSLVNERITSIKSFIAKRKNFGDEVNFIQGKLTSDVSINAIILQKESVFVTLSSKSLLSLNEFINKISTGEGIERFKSIKIKTISKEEGKNVFVLTVSLET